MLDAVSEADIRDAPLHDFVLVDAIPEQRHAVDRRRLWFCAGGVVRHGHTGSVSPPSRHATFPVIVREEERRFEDVVFPGRFTRCPSDAAAMRKTNDRPQAAVT